jgi:hypothetical protein
MRRASAETHLRWLLADEAGGETIEYALILGLTHRRGHRRHRRRRHARVLARWTSANSSL